MEGVARTVEGLEDKIVSDTLQSTRALEGVTHVFHLATVKEDPDLVMDVTIKGLFLLLEAARVSKLAPVGPLVRLRLRVPSGRELEVHLTRERVAALQLAEGHHVYVRPSRVQIFPEDYSI